MCLSNRYTRTRMRRWVLLALLLAALSGAAEAQDGFAQHWENRVRKTVAQQPAWPIPVIAPSPQLVQLVRFDVLRQITPTHFTTLNIDNGRGLNLIPLPRTEIDINLPPLIEHGNLKVVDGAGDFSVVAKYRAFASPSDRHNYSMGGQLAFSVPTGSYKNGVAVSTVSPTVLAGKGYKRLALQSTIGATLPTSSVPSIGRTVIWNSTAQFQVGKIFWPEIETNASYYHLGPNDGKNQTFVSPGMMISKIKFRKDPKDRLSLTIGGGMQIATSTYHAYNHALVFTSRFAF